MTGSTAHTVLSVLTIIVSITMRVSPFPDFYRVHKRRETGEVAVLPVVLLCTNCYMVAIYAYYIDNFFPVFSVSVFGVFTSIAFIAVYYRWSTERPYIHKVCLAAAFFMLLDTIYAILASTGVTRQSKHQIAVVTGWVTIFSSIAMFASPLATIRKIVRTKSAASLPFALCFCNAVNCTLWVAYAAVDNDMFILSPNVAGAILGFIQVTLWFVYRPGKYPQAPQVVAIQLDEIDKIHHANFAEEASISIVVASPRSARASRVSDRDGVSHYSVMHSPSIIHKELETTKK
jgi:solute carrier family 50 protein (sugar transporter)